MSISPEQLGRYRTRLQQRLEQRKQEQLQRQERGWQVARQAAKILKSEWNASKVVLFGSMLETRKIHAHSDIDLAVWNLPEDDYDLTFANLLDINPEFLIDLVEIQHAKPGIMNAIEAGVE